MNRNTLLQLTLSAAATAALTLAALLPVGLRAEGETGPLPVVALEQPGQLPPEGTVVLDGVTIRIEPSAQQYLPGEEVEITVTLTNTTDAEIQCNPAFAVASQPPVEPTARMMPGPTSVWSHELSCELGPGESTSTTLQAGSAGEAGSELVFSVTLGEQNATVCGAMVVEPEASTEGEAAPADADRPIPSL